MKMLKVNVFIFLMIIKNIFYKKWEKIVKNMSELKSRWFLRIIKILSWMNCLSILIMLRSIEIVFKILI